MARAGERLGPSTRVWLRGLGRESFNSASPAAFFSLRYFYNHLESNRCRATAQFYAGTRGYQHARVSPIDQINSFEPVDNFDLWDLGERLLKAS
jgi:hypothetical protein